MRERSRHSSFLYPISMCRSAFFCFLFLPFRCFLFLKNTKKAIYVSDKRVGRQTITELLPHVANLASLYNPTSFEKGRNKIKKYKKTICFGKKSAVIRDSATVRVAALGKAV